MQKAEKTIQGPQDFRRRKSARKNPECLGLARAFPRQTGQKYVPLFIFPLHM